MGNPATTPLPAKRRMWLACVVMLVVLLPFWTVWLGALVRAELNPCAGDWGWLVWTLAPLTVPWLLWLLWLWRTPETRKPKTSSVALTWGVWVFVLLVIADALPGTLHTPWPARQASAVGSLRAINTAERTYAETYHTGFSCTLDALAVPPPGYPPSASSAGLIENVLATTKKPGYTITYGPGLPDAKGIIATYTATARASCEGHANFFTDQSGIIRRTREDRPATANDEPLAE